MKFTKGAWRLGSQRRGVKSKVRRRRWVELKEGAAAGRLWPSDPLGSTPGGAAEMLQGQGRLRSRRRREIGRRTTHLRRR